MSLFKLRCGRKDKLTGIERRWLRTHIGLTCVLEYNRARYIQRAEQILPSSPIAAWSVLLTSARFATASPTVTPNEAPSVIVPPQIFRSGEPPSAGQLSTAVFRSNNRARGRFVLDFALQSFALGCCSITSTYSRECCQDSAIWNNKYRAVLLNQSLVF